MANKYQKTVFDSKKSLADFVGEYEREQDMQILKNILTHFILNIDELWDLYKKTPE